METSGRPALAATGAISVASAGHSALTQFNASFANGGAAGRSRSSFARASTINVASDAVGSLQELKLAQAKHYELRHSRPASDSGGGGGGASSGSISCTTNSAQVVAKSQQLQEQPQIHKQPQQQQSQLQLQPQESQVESSMQLAPTNLANREQQNSSNPTSGWQVQPEGRLGSAVKLQQEGTKFASLIASAKLKKQQPQLQHQQQQHHQEPTAQTAESSSSMALSSDQCNELEHDPDRPNFVQVLRKLSYGCLSSSVIALCWLVIIHTLKWLALKGDECESLNRQAIQRFNASSSQQSDFVSQLGHGSSRHKGLQGAPPTHEITDTSRFPARTWNLAAASASGSRSSTKPHSIGTQQGTTNRQRNKRNSNVHQTRRRQTHKRVANGSSAPDFSDLPVGEEPLESGPAVASVEPATLPALIDESQPPDEPRDSLEAFQSGNDDAGLPVQPVAPPQLQPVFKAPFFTTWFVSIWNLLFLPVFALISTCFFRGEDSDTKRWLVRISIRQFMDNGFTTSQFFVRCALFAFLWTGTIFGIVYALAHLDATAVMALFSFSSALTYFLSWIVLHQQFVGIRIVAVIICTTGIALLAYMDNSRTLESVLIVTGSALCSAVYKVAYQRMFCFWSIAQMSLFFTIIGLFNALLMWPVTLLLYFLGIELIPWRHIPWFHLTAVGALHLTANVIAYFGPIYTYDIFLTLGLMLAVILTSVVDVSYYHVLFTGMKLAGIVLLMIGFLVCLLPENWNESILEHFRSQRAKWKQRLGFRNYQKARGNKVQDLTAGQLSRFRLNANAANRHQTGSQNTPRLK